MLKAAVFVHFEHKRSNFVKFALLLIHNGNHVHSLSGHVVKSAQVNVLKSHVYEITELFRVLEVTIVNQLHQEQVVEEKLSLRVEHDLARTLRGAMQLGIYLFFDGGGVSWQLQSSKEVWQVVREDQDNV